MKRIDGYIDILPMLGIELKTAIDGTGESEYRRAIELQNELAKKEDVVFIKNELGVKVVFSFDYAGETYYFKYDSQLWPENELFASILADDMNQPHVEYNLAICGPYRGVISKSFKKENCTYISGLDILASAHPEENPTFEDETDEEYKGIRLLRHFVKDNSLEGIWDALEIRYQDRANGAEIVEKILSQLVDQYIFDTIIGNNDRHEQNWFIEESQDGSVNLVPPFDNANASSLVELSNFTVESYENRTEHIKYSLEHNIKKFLSTSDEPFVKRLRERLWVLSEENIRRALHKMEKKTGCPLSTIKNSYYKYYAKERLASLQKMLSLEGLPLLRLVDLADILKLSNAGEVFLGEIAITLITPTETFNAVPLSKSDAVHDELFEELCFELFEENEKYLPRVFSIEIHHSIYDDDFKIASIYIPNYVTMYQFEELTNILQTCLANKMEIVASFNGFDPLTGKIDGERQREYRDLSILQVILEEGRLKEFEMPIKKKKEIKKLTH